MKRHSSLWLVKHWSLFAPFIRSSFFLYLFVIETSTKLLLLSVESFIHCHSSTYVQTSISLSNKFPFRKKGDSRIKKNNNNSLLKKRNKTHHHLRRVFISQEIKIYLVEWTRTIWMAERTSRYKQTI